MEVPELLGEQRIGGHEAGIFGVWIRGYCIQRAFWWGEGWKGSMVKRRGLVVRASMWPTATGKGTHRRQSESKGEARDNWNACPTYWLTDSLLALHHPSLTQFPFPIPCTKATPEPMWQPLFSISPLFVICIGLLLGMHSLSSTNSICIWHVFALAVILPVPFTPIARCWCRYSLLMLPSCFLLHTLPTHQNDHFGFLLFKPLLLFVFHVTLSLRVGKQVS